MQYYLFIRHKVREYTNWRSEFDSWQEWRLLQGEKSCQIFVDDNDPNMVTIIAKWQDIESAKKFVSDSQLSEKMQLSGVMEQPEIYFLKKD